MLQASALDDFSNPTKKSKRKPQDNYHGGTRTGMDEKNTNQEETLTAEEAMLKRQVESMVSVDQEFSTRTKSTDTSLKRRQEKLEKERRRRLKNTNAAPIGNSRSSSSANARKAPIPTFNKKRFQAEQKAKDLNDLARQLRRMKKKQKK